MNDPAVVELLRLSARVDSDAATRQRILDAASRLVNWGDLPAMAEAHGLAPLLYVHLSEAGAPIPVEARQRLFAASIQHREANRARFRALGEILDAFEHAAIPVVVLKGAALAHLLYRSPGLRPLSDLDLLVDGAEAARAQSVLSSIGFIAPASPTSRRLMSHHHLPLAMRQTGGHVIQVEIHTDALSRDSDASLPMSRLKGPLQTFVVEGRTAHALGHADMLSHLCRHTAERAPLMRLIWIADVVGHATRYRREIPWADLRRRDPFVINALSLLHLVTPLPDALKEHVAPAENDAMQGIGTGCKPLTEILRVDRSLRDIARDLFAPSEWWLRLYYGIGPDSSLTWQRGIGHPLRVAYWLARRAVAYARWGVRRL